MIRRIVHFLLIMNHKLSNKMNRKKDISLQIEQVVKKLLVKEPSMFLEKNLGHILICTTYMVLENQAIETPDFETITNKLSNNAATTFASQMIMMQSLRIFFSK